MSSIFASGSSDDQDAAWVRSRRFKLVDIATLIILAGLAIIPAMYSGLLTGANEDPMGRMSHVPAAIVNLDQPVPSPSGGDTVQLGDDLTQELLTGTDSRFDWRVMTQQAADSALTSAAVYVVLTIPADFSANAISPADADPMAATSATLTIQTNDGANIIVGSIASSVGSAVSSALANKVSANYLSGIYVSFTSIHDTIVDAATGAKSLQDGLVTAQDGTTELATGLGVVQSGAISLAAGASTAASKATTLASGLTDLAAGASSTAAGAKSLNDALCTMRDQAVGLPGQAQSLSDAMSLVATGASQAYSGITTVATNADQLNTGAATLSTGAGQALTSAQSLASGATTLHQSTTTLASSASTLAQGLDSLLANYDTLTDAQRQDLITQLAGSADALATGATDVDTAAGQIDTGLSTLVGTATTPGLTSLAAGAALGATGAQELATGADTLAQSMATLSSGATSAAQGASAFASGITSLSAGLNQAVQGASQIMSASQKVSTGAAQASSGAGSLSAGITTLSTGASQVNDGVNQAATAVNTIGSGLDDLVTGSQTLADALADGASRVPGYTTDEANHLSQIASQPVQLSAERLNQVPYYGYGLAPYFMGLALWVGAIGFYLMRPPIPKKALEHDGLWPALWRSLVPGTIMGMVQAIGVVLMMLAIGIHPLHLGLVAVVAMATGVTFCAINQGLVSLLGAPGRFLSLLLVALQIAACGGMYPIQTTPALFQWLHPLIPMSYVVQALRSGVAGGGLGIGQVWLGLGVWLVLALTATATAIRLKQKHLAQDQDEIQPAARHAA